jgi:hypothetical protein
MDKPDDLLVKKIRYRIALDFRPNSASCIYCPFLMISQVSIIQPLSVEWRNLFEWFPWLG